MLGKDIIYHTLSHKETPRVAWVPFAGIHAGSLKGYTACEMLRSADKMFLSLMEVNRLYMPDGQPVAFDLQLEAEALGCELLWSNDNPPSVVTHPLEMTQSIPKRFITLDSGRIPVVMEAGQRLKAAVGEHTALYGLVCGPLTLASHLRGTQLFRDFRKNPEYVRVLLAYCLENSLRMIEYYVQMGADVVAPVDPVVSQISPQTFLDFLMKPYQEIFGMIREKGRFSSFFVCGNAIKNLEMMCRTGPDSISVDENISIKEAKKITDRYQICIGGNIPLTTTMLYGSQQDNMKYVLDLLDSVTHENLIVSPGCDMPYMVPMQNAIAVANAVHNTKECRSMLKNYEASDYLPEVKLPDYKKLQRPLVEAFTLDSASCAACTYVWRSVCDAKVKFGDQIDIVEHKYTTLDGISRCKKMSVDKLPSVYLNGRLLYSSCIPDTEEFYTKITASISEMAQNESEK